MPDLTFGEQVKIILSRKGMTIKELAETIEAETGKKMSRQNLTQRLGRDNFQEQDMRMIARILEVPFYLNILEEDDSVEVITRKRKSKKEAAVVEKAAAEEMPAEAAPADVLAENASAPADIVAESASSEEEAAPEEELQLEFVDLLSDDEPETAEESQESERDLTVDEVLTMDEDISQIIKRREEEEREQKEAEEKAKAEAYAEVLREMDAIENENKEREINQKLAKYQAAKEQEMKKEKKSRSWFDRFGRKKKDEEEMSGPALAPKEEPIASDTTIEEVISEPEAEPEVTEQQSLDMREIAPPEEVTGEINPYTGKEYEDNTVRMHEKRIGYVQVYDGKKHQWVDMTEWAFLGNQERLKRALGADYVEPIYLD